MKPAQAIRLAGSQTRLHAIFVKGGFKISKQAVSLWAAAGGLPPKRELQLRRLRPWWFARRKRGNGVIRNPKPKQPPDNLAAAPGIRKVRKGGAMKKRRAQPPGPPFLPGSQGNPETKL